MITIKAAGPCGIVIEMIRSAAKEIIESVTNNSTMIIERVLDSVIRSQVDIDSMQFGFMPSLGTTDAIFVLRQL